MRFTFKLGAVTIFDLAMFEADETETQEAVAVLGNEATSLGFTAALPDRITYTDDEW